MKEIKEGLESEVDVSIYAKPEFDWEQMQQIRIRLEAEKQERFGKSEVDEAILRKMNLF